MQAHGETRGLKEATWGEGIVPASQQVLEVLRHKGEQGVGGMDESAKVRVQGCKRDARYRPA